MPAQVSVEGPNSLEADKYGNTTAQPILALIVGWGILVFPLSNSSQRALEDSQCLLPRTKMDFLARRKSIRRLGID